MIIKFSYFFIPFLSPDWLLIPRGLAINHKLSSCASVDSHTTEGLLGAQKSSPAPRLSVEKASLMWVSRWWTRWQEGLPAPLPVWGDTSACSTGGVHELRKLGARWMTSHPPGCWLGHSTTGGLFLPWPWYKACWCHRLPSNQAKWGGDPEWWPAVRWWISLSGWKIFRGYYFPKGWPPSAPISISGSLNAFQCHGEDRSETWSAVPRLALIPVSLEPTTESCIHAPLWLHPEVTWLDVDNEGQNLRPLPWGIWSPLGCG